MAHTFGVQDVLAEPLSNIEFSSSPPQPVSNIASRKIRKPPPITPKRFTRFFTPRSTVHGSSRDASLSHSARQLQDITGAALNRSNVARRSTPRKTVNFADAMDGEQAKTPVNRLKRKTPYLSPESSPAQFSPSPSKRSRFQTPPPFTILEDEPSHKLTPPPPPPPPPAYPLPIRRLKSLCSTPRILQRSFGGSVGVGRGFRRDNCISWQDHTSRFFSGSDDCAQLPQDAPLFCTSSCNSNSLVAVGDEDGWVHFIDADNEATSSFAKAHVSFKAHTNAIMDVQFSSDDAFLATGSGDQTAQIIDARTQQCVHVLSKHKSSVRQVRFQPGDDKIVATSSRDGSVQIWDLRCKGGHDNVHSIWGSAAPYVGSVRHLTGIHADGSVIASISAATSGTKDFTAKNEAPSRRGEASVTSLSFLSAGREHLLLTASDASTCVKLWDIRARYSRRGPAIPISTTRHPDSHTRHRHFAINALTLSGDANRLYALSKDNTVYAYSTSHLILGVAPELATSKPSSTGYASYGKEGLGPIYGFRHKNFHVGSFYVKLALREAAGDRSELLAVGSTDGCPILFPTDENLLRCDGEHRAEETEDLPGIVTRRATRSRTSLSRKSSSSHTSALIDTIPIYEHGTPLIRGHEAEVGGVTWAKNGSLITLGDDYRVRRWKEGPEARQLRQGGEAEGRRWQCGWAVVNEGYDEDD